MEEKRYRESMKKIRDMTLLMTAKQQMFISRCILMDADMELDRELQKTNIVKRLYK